MPDRFVLIERWRSQQSWEAHMASPHLVAFLPFAETHVAHWELLKLRSTELADDERAGRGPAEVAAHHSAALGAQDLDAILHDYDDRSAVVTPGRTYRGRAEIRAFFEDLLRALPHARWHATVHHEAEVQLMEWTAESPVGRVRDGVDTFVFEHGMIRLQTARCTIEPEEPGACK